MDESVPNVWPDSVAGGLGRASGGVGKRIDLRAGRPGELRQAEIDDLHLPRRRDEDVRGLDIPVHDAGGVRGLERIGRLDGQVEQERDRQRRAVDAVAQRLPVEQLHDEERQIAMPPDVVERADVRVVQRRGRPGLTLEPFERRRIGRELRRQKFDRDLTAEPRVLGAINDTHPALPDLVEDAVVRDGLADHRY